MRDLTRRQMLTRGGAAVAGISGLSGAGVAGYAWPHGVASAASASASTTEDGSLGVQHFVGRPDLQPPAVTLSHSRQKAGPATDDPPYVFLTPKGYPSTGPGQPGLMIVDRRGGLVWFSPSNGLTQMDLNVQSYQGKPVLTWWEGKVIDGYGQGQAVIADSSYQTIGVVKGGNGLQADLHEFVITPQGTALVTAYRTAQADLSAVGGKPGGYVLSGVAQEIDIASGTVVFEWDSLDHVPVTATQQGFSGGTKSEPFDYFHINSIAVAPDGDLLISSRNTCALYKVARPSGTVRWTLGGKRSSFRMASGAQFYFQHHARPQGTSSVSLFDDGGSPARESQSRAILLDLDTTTMTARLKSSYTHSAGLLAQNQGSMQVLPDGRVFVGWGNLPYFSEFLPDGTLTMDGQLPVPDQSYRTFTAAWTGQPATGPTLTARSNPAGGSTVYASWNGATEVERWTVLAGTSGSDLAPAGSQQRAGFETAITVNTTGPYFAVKAQDSSGRQLAQSVVVRKTGD
ncbi:MAG TPA: arylsulfotransferase family protein [Trebonia sp.]|nr:arylsulfotransferase family protein [Trebonia sp.]